MANQENRKRYLVFAIVLALAVRLLFAYLTVEFRTSDYNKHLSTWYDEIYAMGGIPALREQVGNYGILYQFLICLMTYLPISSLAAYKLLSMIFDILLAIASGLLIYELCDDRSGNKRYLPAVCGGMIALLLPTVILNSSVWAQCDSIYTTFAVLSVLCLCKQYDIAAFALFGIAISFKLQAVFVMPVLLFIAFMRRELHYLVVSVISWYVTCIPGFLAGRSLLSPLTIYQNQAEQYKAMTMNFPSLWVLSSGDYSKWGHIAILGTIAVLAIYMLVILYRYRGHYERLTALSVLEIACLFTWTCVEFLPCMHERYSYCLEILLLVLVMIEHRYLLCLLIEEGEILMRYRSYLYEGGTLASVDAIIYLLAYMVFAMMVMVRIVRVEHEC